MNLKPDIETLPLVSAIVGVTLALIGAATLLNTPAAARIWKALPRSVWPGRVLTAVCLAWSMLWVFVMPPPFPQLEAVRPHLWWITPVAIVAVCVCIPELLTCRAIGGLLVLAPAPMLSAAAWHPSEFRYVVVITAYVFIFAGMFYIAFPWMLRDHIDWVLRTLKRTRICAMAFTVLGIALCVLAMSDFRLG